MTTFIYLLCEPDGDPRYVGKSNNPIKRLCDHAHDKGENRKARWLRKLRASGLQPRIIILDEVERTTWQIAESQWIAYFTSQGVDLCNLTTGGEGVTIWAERSLQRLRDARCLLLANPEYRARFIVATQDPNRRAAISAALTGRKHSPEHVAKLPQNKAGRKLSPTHATKVRAVLQQHGWHWPKGSFPEKARIAALEALKGNTHTLGRVMPEHERIQRSIANKGRSQSPEHREKIRAAQLVSWARRKAATA